MSDDVMTGDPSATPPTPEELAANPSLMDRHSNFGPETASSDLDDRDFEFGEQVVVTGDAVVQDKERRNEGMTDIEFNPTTGERNPNFVPLDKRELCEFDIKGEKGTVLNGSYYSEKHGDEMVPIETRRGGLIYVRSKSLDRANRGQDAHGKTTIALSAKLTPEERKLASDYTEYRGKEMAARMEGLAFPTFTDWLALKTPKEN